MRAQKAFSTEELDDWKNQLSGIIPNVDSETTITGIRNTEGATLFYKNGEIIGQIDDTRFTQGFFNIWLGENTSETGLRSQLLGL